MTLYIEIRGLLCQELFKEQCVHMSLEEDSSL